ncbi:MAG: response regulator, partial [Chloroflexota bacterium]|nr:response regulator [Chloroflexota bacterium]
MENPKTNLPNDEAPVILHADDDPVEREIIQRILKQGRVPARLCSVQDGQQAMDYLAGQGEYADRARFPLPDLILLDLKMPRKTGFDVLEWRRTQAACARVPVIVVTTLREDREVARAFQLGANSYLVKPVLA